MFFQGSLEEESPTPQLKRRRSLVVLLLGMTVGMEILIKSARGDNLWEGAKSPFPTNPIKTKIIFLVGHSERSEESPIQSKGLKDPLRTSPEDKKPTN